MALTVTYVFMLLNYAETTKFTLHFKSHVVMESEVI